jgi:hypothetical protein
MVRLERNHHIPVSVGEIERLVLVAIHRHRTRATAQAVAVVIITSSMSAARLTNEMLAFLLIVLACYNIYSTDMAK